jgi:hypothetical protein
MSFMTYTTQNRVVLAVAKLLFFFYLDRKYDSWTSDYTSSDSSSDSKAELFSLDSLPQVVTGAMSHLEDEYVEPTKSEKILQLVKFGPNLSHGEKDELQDLVKEFAELFITRHQDLPNIVLEEHHIELKENVKPVRERQKRMAPEKAAILKAELDRLLEGGLIIQVKNTEWVSPVVIVPKKGGKWRICINYKALNLVTKKDHQPLSFIDELLDDVAGNEIFTFCDGYSGYHQIKI